MRKDNDNLPEKKEELPVQAVCDVEEFAVDSELVKQAQKGDLDAIKEVDFKQVKRRRKRLMEELDAAEDAHGVPAVSVIQFDKISVASITSILATGKTNALTDSQRAYYDLMLQVRGWLMKSKNASGRVISHAGIIQVLKQLHGLSDWMARRVVDDTQNFFFGVDNVTPKAYANLYADRLDKLASAAMEEGDYDRAAKFWSQAAKLRGADKAAEKVEDVVNDLPQPSVIIYTTQASDLGLEDSNLEEVRQIIDSIPDVPEFTRECLREDARIKPMDLKKRLLHDRKEFGSEQ